MAKKIVTEGDGETIWLPGEGTEDAQFSIFQNGTLPPTVDDDDGAPLFRPNLDDILKGWVKMSHSWKMGDYILPHLHWETQAEGTGFVCWKLEIKRGAIGQNFDDDWLVKEILHEVNGDSLKHIGTPFSKLGMRGMGPGSIIKWKLTRLGTSETDTFPKNVKLLDISAHYQINSIGSGEPHSKI
jgi:hypothetical protein